MKNIKDIIDELDKLNLKIKENLYQCGFLENRELTDISFEENKERKIYLEKLSAIFSFLEIVSDEINYLQSPIRVTGELKRNKKGSFEVNGYEIKEEDIIEYFVDDFWNIGSIDHNGFDFCLSQDWSIELEGLMVRVR